MPPLVIVFAKAPVPGAVKTRLVPPLDAAAAVGLHEAFVRDTLDIVAALGADVELHTDRPCECWPGVPQRLQCAGDLGVRMAGALSGALGAGRAVAMIVGSDAPSLPADHLRALLATGADIALGPAEDGGYYAIAARRVAQAMFQGVAWSTASALTDTVAAAAQSGLGVAVGPSWFDVDDAASLARLIASGPPPHTARFLERNPAVLHQLEHVTQSGREGAGNPTHHR